MATVEIVLGGAEGDMSLSYDVKQTPVALRWLSYLEAALEEHAPIEQYVVNGRLVGGHFIGYPNTDINRGTLAARINECIDVWNGHAPGTITLRAAPEQGQAELNRLHKEFELCRGRVHEPPPIFASAPDHAKRALENFNYLIHEFENLIRSEGGKEEQANVSMEVMFLGSRPQHRLRDEDFDQFTMASQFGEMYVHYCEVGKEIVDIYLDGDELVGDDNIRPQRHVSAEFDCYFGTSWSIAYECAYRKKLDPWLRAKGYEPADKRLSLGRIPVATLLPTKRFDGLTRPECVDLLSRFMDVKQVSVHR